MPTFEEKYDHQEITVEELSQVYKIANDYNLFYKLPRQGRGDQENQNLVSALSITINKILCQFFEFTQNLKRSLYTAKRS